MSAVHVHRAPDNLGLTGVAKYSKGEIDVCLRSLR